MFAIMFIADSFDFAINGANLFSVDNNPFFNPDDIDPEYRDEAINAMKGLEDNWGNPEPFLKTNIGNLELPNLTNVGVLFAFCLYCLSWISWVKVGEKYIIPKLEIMLS